MKHDKMSKKGYHHYGKEAKHRYAGMEYYKDHPEGYGYGTKHYPMHSGSMDYHKYKNSSY